MKGTLHIRTSESVVIYNRFNPPPGDQEARLSLSRLQGEIATIETQLSHASADDYQDVADYEAWRDRANRAITVKQNQIRFLEGWLRQQCRPQTTQGRPVVSEKTLREKARRLAEELGYASLYSQDSLPRSVFEAQQRSDQLSILKNRIQGHFSEIMEEAAENSLNAAWLGSVKAPLQKVLTKIEIEKMVLKGYIRERSEEEDSQKKGWYPILAEALGRAVAGGFILTSEEAEVLAAIKQRRNKN